MHLMSGPSIVFRKPSIHKCPLVWQHMKCRHSNGEVPFGLITGTYPTSAGHVVSNHSIWIMTQSGSSLGYHHWCYLFILLIIGSSKEPTLFHVGYRPSLYVGLLQRLYLTLSQIGPLLSTQMALLRPSADISYVGTQKDIYGLKVS